MEIERQGTTRRYSDFVAQGGTVYLVEVPGNPGADITAQTRDLLARLEASLQRAGSDKSKLLLTTIYLRDLADCAAMNAAWDDWVPAGQAPTRACVEAKLTDPQLRVEMVVIAAR